MVSRSSIVILALTVSILRTTACYGLSIVEKGPIEWNPSVDPQPPTLVIEVANTTDTDSDNVLLWQLEVEIVPANDSTGVLEFDSIGQPPANNYLYGDCSENFYEEHDFYDPPTIAFINDLECSRVGIPIAAGEQFALAQLNFNSTPVILGTFDVTVLPPPGNFEGSLWLDGLYNDMEFTNVPSSEGSVIIGSIVVVPESRTLTLALYCLVASYLWPSRC